MRKLRIYAAVLSIGLVLILVLPVSAAVVPSPVSVDRQTINGEAFVVKTFTVSTDITAEMLVEDDFELDGYIFRHMDTENQENVSETSRRVTRQATLETPTNAQASIRGQFAQSINYGEGGYFGTLTLDEATFVTRVSGYGTRSVTINRTREYPGLMFNDPAAVPQAISYNGVTLALANIEWVVTATALAGDVLVPVEYKAIASYSGVQRVSYVTGYTTTVYYTGIVARRVVESVNFTVTYTGTEIPPPATESPPPPPATELPETTEAPEPEPEPVSEDEGEDEDEMYEPVECDEATERTGGGWVLPAAIAGAALAGGLGGWYYMKYIRKSR